MHAIRTRLIPATNTQGNRITAQCDAKRMIFNYNEKLTVRQNHIESAKKFLDEMEWDWSMIVSGEFRGDYYHCYTNPEPV